MEILIIIILSGQYLGISLIMVLYSGFGVFTSKKHFMINLIPFYWVYEACKILVKAYKSLDKE